MNPNLLWIPADIPKFPIENFELDVDANWKFWKFKKITIDTEKKYSRTEISSSIIEQYPSLISWLQNFPYISIRNVKFNIQTTEVSAHIDFVNPEIDPELWNNNHHNEPCGYRVLISGSRNKNLYVVDGGNKIYTHLPESTDTYILNHTAGLHGVDNEVDRKTLFLHFEIDSLKHGDILSRSMIKYADYAVYKK